MGYSASIRTRSTNVGVSYDVRFRLGDKQRTVTFTNESKANTWLQLVRQHGPEQAITWLNRDAAPTAPTVTEYAETYIASKSGVEGKTLDHYRMFMRRSIGPAMGHLPLNLVTPDIIAAWVNEQANPTQTVNGTVPKPLSAKTIKNRHGFLYAMFKHAVSRGVVDRNPCEGTGLPESEQREMVFLSPDEYAHLVSYVPEYWQPLIHLLAGTGLRWSEAVALRPGDFDLTAGVVRVSRAWKDSLAKGRYLGPPKTRRSKRTVSLFPSLIEQIAPLVEQRGEFVFTDLQGRPVIQQVFHKNVWAPARNLAAGLPAFAVEAHGDRWAPTRGGFTWDTPPADEATRIHKMPRLHDLRHTHASWLINAGVPLPVIQRRLGHESITTTVDRYGHLSPDNFTLAARAAASAMSEALPELMA